MIGRHSICYTFRIKNDKDPKNPFVVGVQGNKNGGICDLILQETQKEPTKPFNTSNGEVVRAYNAAKENYDSYKRARAALRSEFLNCYQGRQLDGEYMRESITNFLKELLNR